MMFDWTILWGKPGLLILQGLFTTLELSAWVLLLAFLIGLVVGTVRWRIHRALSELRARYSASRSMLSAKTSISVTGEAPKP